MVSAVWGAWRRVAVFLRSLTSQPQERSENPETLFLHRNRCGLVVDRLVGRLRLDVDELLLGPVGDLGLRIRGDRLVIKYAGRLVVRTLVEIEIADLHFALGEH